MSDIEKDLRELRETLGLTFDVDLIANQFRRINAESSIAVIGLVSRGKSTLINEIVGIPICPVDARAETVATLKISSGIESFGLFTRDGRLSEQVSDLKNFRERLTRTSNAGVTTAEISLNTRLPRGITLVDTPGTNDAVLRDNARKWRDLASAGAILVVAYPPGFSSEDRRLFEAVRDVYGDNFEIVVKATDASIPDSAVKQVADNVARHTRKRSLVIGQDLSVGPWGNGKTGEVDLALDRLAAQVDTGRKQAMHMFRELTDEIALSIALLGAHALDNLRRSLSVAKRVSPELGDAVRKKIYQIIDLEREAQANAERIAEHKRQHRMAIEVSQIESLLPEPNEFDPVFHSEALKLLVDLVNRGSVTAATLLKNNLAFKPEYRKDCGLSLLDSVERWGWTAALSLLENSELSENELEQLLSLTDDSLVSPASQFLPLHRALNRMGESELMNIFRFAKSLTMRDLVRIKVIKLKMQRVSQVADESKTTADLVQVVNEVQLFMKIINSDDESLKNLFVSAGVYRDARDLLEQCRRVAVRTLEQRTAQMFQNPINNNEHQLIEEIQNLQPSVNWLVGFETVTSKSEVVSLWIRDGWLHQWLLQCQEAKSLARFRSKTSNRRNLLFYMYSVFQLITSCGLRYLVSEPDLVGWFPSTWLPSGVVASWAIVISVAICLVARFRHNNPKPWTHFFVIPGIPENLWRLEDLYDDPIFDLSRYHPSPTSEPGRPV